MSATQHQPEPELEELEQHDVPGPVVPVNVMGPVTTHPLPSKGGPAFVQPLVATSFTKVLSHDLKRARTTLLLGAAWEYSRTGGSGSGVPWPSNVPLVLEHCDQVWARVVADTGNLSVITEVWAD
jgi:hypothetical protein